MQRGTLLGGLGRAGIGALVGKATGHTAVGTAVGAGAGAIAGAAVGSQMDNNEARKQAAAAAQADIDPGGATTVDVLQMTRAGVPPQEIINYVNHAGMLDALTTQDVIYLRNQGVSSEVVQAMIAARVVGMPPQRVRILPQHQAVISWPTRSTTPIICTTTQRKQGSNSCPGRLRAAGAMAWAIAATAQADYGPLSC
jgi:hypothetical protein